MRRPGLVLKLRGLRGTHRSPGTEGIHPSARSLADALTRPLAHSLAHLPARVGFTLIELLTVLALLSVVGFLVVHLVIKSIELNRLAMNQLTQIITQGDLATMFRTDVAAASGRLDSLGTFVADPQTLILDFAPDSSPPPSAPQVVWQWDGSRLWRTTFDKDVPTRVVVAPEQRFQDVSFDVEQADGATRTRMRLISYVFKKHEQRQRPTGVEVEAWLGAERR